MEFAKNYQNGLFTGYFNVSNDNLTITGRMALDCETFIVTHYTNYWVMVGNSWNYTTHYSYTTYETICSGYGGDTGDAGYGGDSGGGGSGAINQYEDVIVEDIAQVIEDNIDDSKLDPCTKGILSKLKSQTTNDIASIFTKLGGDSQIYTLTFEIANNNGNPASTISTSYNCYKTTIDNDFLYGIDGTGINKPPTDLAIAAVMIHEVVHAYFFSLFDDKANSGVTNAFDNFYLLYQNYVTKTYVGADDAQHAQIWKNFIGKMASALQEYHTGSVTDAPTQFYQDIILGTLSRTQIFKDKYPEGTAEFRRIMDNYRTETSNGKTIPNSIPKGTPCPK